MLQYIGARYVPQFFKNPNGGSQWLKNYSYQPLTMVSDANARAWFISKAIVPANTELTNTEFWAQWSGYDYSQLRDMINEVNSNLTEAIQAGDQKLQNNINTLQNNTEAGLEKLKTEITNLDTEFAEKWAEWESNRGKMFYNLAEILKEGKENLTANTNILNSLLKNQPVDTALYFYVPNGYVFYTIFNISNNHDVVVKGPGTIKGGFTIENSHNVYLEDIILEFEEGVRGYGVRILNSYSIKLFNLNIQGFSNDGILLDIKGTEVYQNKNIFIQNCIFSDNNIAIAMSASSFTGYAHARIFITNCLMFSVRYNVSIRNCQEVQFMNNMLACSQDSELIKQNTYGIIISNSSIVNIKNNSLYQIGTNAIDIGLSNNIYIQGNDMFTLGINSYNSSAIFCNGKETGNKNIIIVSNTIINPSGSGFTLSQINKNVLIANNFIENPGSYYESAGQPPETTKFYGINISELSNANIVGNSVINGVNYITNSHYVNSNLSNSGYLTWHNNHIYNLVTTSSAYYELNTLYNPVTASYIGNVRVSVTLDSALKKVYINFDYNPTPGTRFSILTLEALNTNPPLTTVATSLTTTGDDEETIEYNPILDEDQHNDYSNNIIINGPLINPIENVEPEPLPLIK